MNKIIILLALFLIPFTSASVGYEEIDYGVHYISPEAPINYSLIPTVNNTEYFDSYSVDTLWDYIKSLGNDVWYSIDNPFGYYNSTTLDLSGLVPYTGATADVDLGAFDFFAKSGDFSENVTIGEDGIQQNHLINNALLSYDTFFPVIYKQGLFNNDGNYRFEQTSGTGKYIFNRNVEIGGDLTATNLNGTNTGDQDLSPYLDTTDAATTYVPYGGANQNVDIGAYDLTATTLTDGTATITGGSLTSVKLGSLTTNGFVTTSGADGTLGIDTNTYLDTTDAATTYVPYGGANQNVDIGAYDFKATDGEFIGKLSVNAHYTSGQQLKVKDGTHSFGILSSDIGYGGMVYDAYFTGSSWVATDPATSLIYKTPTGFTIYSDGGLTAGNTFTPTVRLQYFSTGDYFQFTGNVKIAGETLLSNKLKFTQTDGNEFIDSLNDGYLDFGATTGFRFNNDIDVGAYDIQTTGSVKGVHKTADGTSAVADGTYTTGIGATTNGTITITDGIITSVTEAVA